jgi:hypothetical protein
MTSLGRPAQPASTRRDDSAPPQHRDDESLYRDGTQAMRQEIARLRKSLVTAIAATSTAAGPFYRARRARMVAGCVLVGCAVLVLAGTIGQRGFAIDHLVVTPVLLASWPAVVLASLLAGAHARRDFARHMHAQIRDTRDAHADLERLRRYDPGQHAMRMLSDAEHAGLGLLLAGLAALLPLTILFIAFLAMAYLREDGYVLPSVLVFDDWIWGSLEWTIQCQVVLAVCAWHYGKHLTTVPTAGLLQRGREQGGKIYKIVCCLVFFPVVRLGFMLQAFMNINGDAALRSFSRKMTGQFFALVTVAIAVGVMGVIIPILYRWAAHLVTDERDALATAMPQARSPAPET